MSMNLNTPSEKIQARSAELSEAEDSRNCLGVRKSECELTRAAAAMSAPAFAAVWNNPKDEAYD